MLSRDVRANHVTQRVVLLHDLESGCIGYFGVFCDFDTVTHLSSVCFKMQLEKRTVSRRLRGQRAQICLARS